jgi:hypothetical protein
MKLIERNQNFIFLFYVLISVALRFFSFFPSVMDHDESTYLIIGRDILNGKDLYTEVTDSKPVGIFLFFAGLEYIFGSSIFLKRLAFAVLVAATGFFVNLVSRKLFHQNKVAFASGVIYILYVSIWNLHGLSPNTELLFNFCTIAALLLFLNPGIRNYLFGGLIMGIGFLVKYVVLFDFAAFMLFFLIYEMITPENRRKGFVWARFIIAGLAFLVPFALTNLYFWSGDHFQDFFFITYQLPGNYGNSPSLTRYLIMILDFTAKFLPISFLVVYVVFKRNKPLEEKHKWFFMLWVFSVLIAIYMMGKEFSHYTVQLMLPFSLIAGLFFHPEFKPDRISGLVYSRKYGLVILGVILLVIQFLGFKNELIKPDYEREVAGYISEKMNPGDKVYVSNYHQIIYYLLKIDSPTKYIHSNLLFTETYKAFNINAETEIKRIISTKPRFVIIQNNNVFVGELIANQYREVKDFRNNQIKVYEIKP